MTVMTEPELRAVAAEIRGLLAGSSLREPVREAMASLESEIDDFCRRGGTMPEQLQHAFDKFSEVFDADRKEQVAHASEALQVAMAADDAEAFRTAMVDLLQACDEDVLRGLMSIIDEGIAACMPDLESIATMGSA